MANANAGAGSAVGPGFDFKPSQRYPDPAVQILDPSFAKYRIYSSTVEQVGTGMRWAEGPVYFGDARCLLVSDIPNNRIMRYDEVTGSFTVWRQPSNFSNGMCRDRQGRLLTCEHLTRRVTRTEYNGKITVLADKFNGKPLNSPNDIVCKSDGSIWFTDPPFGIGGHWEGEPAPSERCATAMVRLSASRPKRAISTPRPEMRPGSGWSLTSTGSIRDSSALALEATLPTRRLGWWLQKSKPARSAR